MKVGNISFIKLKQLCIKFQLLHFPNVVSSEISFRNTYFIFESFKRCMWPRLSVYSSKPELSSRSHPSIRLYHGFRQDKLLIRLKRGLLFSDAGLVIQYFLLYLIYSEIIPTRTENWPFVPPLSTQNYIFSFFLRKWNKVLNNYPNHTRSSRSIFTNLVQSRVTLPPFHLHPTPTTTPYPGHPYHVGLPPSGL